MSEDQTALFGRDNLLERLRAVQQADSPVGLRQAVALLREVLEAPASDECETVALPRQFLADEIEQIANAQTQERARYYAERLHKSITEERTNGINDLNLNRWKTYPDILTDSLWNFERRDNSGVHTASYWGNFIPQIPNQLIRRYTKPGEWVLDPFCGSGTSLIEAHQLGRNALGIELQPKMVHHTQELLRELPTNQPTQQIVVEGDSTQMDLATQLASYGTNSVQLAILHPPYHDIITFSDDPRDLSNAPNIEAFLTQLGQVAHQVATVLDQGRFLGLVISDTYQRGEWIPLGFQAMEVVKQQGFSLKSIVVKNFETTTGKRQQKELWRYRALVGGFYIFKHEYVFLLRKR